MFSDNLKQLRLSYNLTQKELAEELGTSQATYNKWEAGSVSPTLTSVEKIAKFFDVPVSRLVYNNVARLEDLLDADFIECNEIPLYESDVYELKSYLLDFISNNLKYCLNSNMTKNIQLKNGKFVAYTKNNP